MKTLEEKWEEYQENAIELNVLNKKISDCDFLGFTGEQYIITEDDIIIGVATHSEDEEILTNAGYILSDGNYHRPHHVTTKIITEALSFPLAGQ